MTKRDTAVIAALALASLALRLAFRIDYDEDIDALRFALGVERFDVAELRPHAPYYPVYIAAAKLLRLVLGGAGSREALGVLSALAGAASVAATALLAREVCGRVAGLVAGALALASPFLWLASERLMSDMSGVAVTTTALFLCARARRSHEEGRADHAARDRTAALVLLGIGLGVRLSYFPIALACAVVIVKTEGGRRAWLTRGRDLATGVMLWLAPLVAVANPRELVTTTWMQATGHFTRWGGTAITVSSPLERLYGVAWGVWANVLGGAWPDAPSARLIAAPVLVLFLGLAVRRARPILPALRAQPELAASVIAYFAWAALGQNTAYKPRHWLPLAPLLIVAVAAGASALLERGGRAEGARARQGGAAVPILVLFGQWLVDGASLARAHKAPSPAAAIVGFLARESLHGEDRRPVVTADLARMIDEGTGSRARVVWAPHTNAVIAAVVEEGDAGALITSEALTQAARDELMRRGYTLTLAFSRPRSRYVDALWSDLALISAQRPTPPLSP